MTTWRMAFRMGSQGPSLWPLCYKYGVAAVSYEDVDGHDLSRVSPNDIAEDWNSLSSSQKASLRHVAYEMKKGDVIYAKEGAEIVGRGRVLGVYKYALSNKIVDEEGTLWPHQVPVLWEPGFNRVRVVVGADLHTVLELNKTRLRLLEMAFKKAGRAALKQEADEGNLASATVRFRRRNRALVEAKRAMHLQRNEMRCEVCGFSFRSFFSHIERESLEVHHKNPLAEQKAVIVTSIDDLVLLCPNCHRACHSFQPGLDTDELRKLVRRRRRKA